MYRVILEKVRSYIFSENPPIILILGLRQVGKSTLVQTICKDRPFARFNFDLVSDISEFTNQDRHSLGLFARKYKDQVIIVDEVQKSPEAVNIIKHLYDTYKLRFLLTGSSEVKIRRGVGDSLAGRLREFKLYPLSLEEIDIQSGLNFDREIEFNNYEFNQEMLMRYLVYGSLPELLNIKVEDYKNYLNSLTNSIFSKDVLEVSGTRKPVQVFHLAKLLAHQIGQIVNYNELSQMSELSRISVVNFIETFEKMGLIVKANPISANNRESITKRTKIYFTDLGIRNSLIANFSDYRKRFDQGALLENAIFVGMKRSMDYQSVSYELGFFRSEYGSEMDIVKKVGGEEYLFEVKTKAKHFKKIANLTFIDL